MMKALAVSQRTDEVSIRGEVRDALDQNLISFLLHCNMIGYPVPNEICSSGAITQWLQYLSPKGVVLSGGTDIGSNEKRDATERALLLYALEMRLPVLGICRGMQFIATEAGVELEELQDHVSVRHQLFGDFQREVNSFHKFGFSIVPPEYEVLARAGETIEAMKHKKLKWEGWMWHPEREIPFSDIDLARLMALMS